ncbi:MAG: SpoIIE family protein phosphatase [Caldilineaceae bacterium]
MTVEDPPQGNAAASQPTLLVQHPFLNVLTGEEIAAITGSLEPAEFAPGTIFVREGAPGDCAYILLTGSVEVIKALGTADERSFGLRGPGDTIGEMSLLDPDEPRSASVRTVTQVEALVITRDDLESLLLQFPQVSLQLLRNFSRRLRTSENATIRDLQEKNSRLNQAYLELKAAQQKIVEQEVLAHELAQAKRIQLRMLPAALPSYGGAVVGAAIRAARSVGGDLYDVFNLGPDRLGFAIGDVSGKGMPAALYMALVSSLLRAEAGQDAAPETVVRRVNKHLCERDMDDMFVTLLYCELDLHTRCLHTVRAGHEHPLLWAGTQLIQPPTPGRAMPLGIVADPRLELQNIVLPPAATFILYTDGVTDAIDDTSRPFGRARLVETVARNLHLGAQALCDTVVNTVLAYHGIMPQFDDVTLLVLKLD